MERKMAVAVKLVSRVPTHYHFKGVDCEWGGDDLETESSPVQWPTVLVKWTRR